VRDYVENMSRVDQGVFTGLNPGIQDSLIRLEGEFVIDAINGLVGKIGFGITQIDYEGENLVELVFPECDWNGDYWVYLSILDTGEEKGVVEMRGDDGDDDVAEIETVDDFRQCLGRLLREEVREIYEGNGYHISLRDEENMVTITKDQEEATIGRVFSVEIDLTQKIIKVGSSVSSVTS